MNAIHKQSGDASRTSAVFKYQGQVYFFIALLAVDSLFLFMGFAVEEGKRIRQESFSSSDLFFMGLLLIFFLLQLPNLRSRSDIVVDDQGISRRFLGCTWQTIRWDNIRVILSFQLLDSLDQKSHRQISICPAARSLFRLTPSSAMGFDDQVVNMSELIEVMNRHITQYKINIETVDRNGRHSATQL
jgi:hypothetical protein